MAVPTRCAFVQLAAVHPEGGDPPGKSWKTPHVTTHTLRVGGAPSRVQSLPCVGSFAFTIIGRTVKQFPACTSAESWQLGNPAIVARMGPAWSPGWYCIQHGTSGSQSKSPSSPLNDDPAHPQPPSLWPTLLPWTTKMGAVGVGAGGVAVRLKMTSGRIDGGV